MLLPLASSILLASSLLLTKAQLSSPPCSRREGGRGRHERSPSHVTFSVTSNTCNSLGWNNKALSPVVEQTAVYLGNKFADASSWRAGRRFGFFAISCSAPLHGCAPAWRRSTLYGVGTATGFPAQPEADRARRRAAIAEPRGRQGARTSDPRAGCSAPASRHVQPVDHGRSTWALPSMRVCRLGPCRRAAPVRRLEPVLSP